jgi:hypothetical protein
MIKNSDGQVIFMQSWWRACLSYAAKALNRFHKEVEKIQVDPIVCGTLSLYKRFYASDKFTYHECFEANTVISVSFSLPDRVDLAAFREILEVGGRYVGVSPYGYRADYGRFAVVSVERSRKHRSIREPDTGVSGTARLACGADVQAQDAGGRQSS